MDLDEKVIGVKVKGYGADVADEQAVVAREAAQHMIDSRVADRAQSAVNEEGLSLSAVAEAARHLAEGIREGAQCAMKQVTTGTGPQERTESRRA